MYANKWSSQDTVFSAETDADERTIAWLKRDVERRRAERAEAKGELVSAS